MLAEPRRRVACLALLVGLALLASLAGCRCQRRATPSSGAPRALPESAPAGSPGASALAASPRVPSAGVLAASPPLEARELTWDYPDTAVGPMRVVVSVPARGTEDERFPVLFLLHGMGEAVKGPALGARGFIDDYWMPRAIDRLRRPPLGRGDFLGMVTDARLAAVNAALDRVAFRGLVVVCPFTPTSLRGPDAGANAVPYAAFLVDEVLSRVRREAPALDGVVATGIDGVSLGGRGAVLVALARPDAFGVVAALQPAFDPREIGALVPRVRAAVAAHPGLRWRLVTSRGDFYLESTRSLAGALGAAGVEAPLVVLEGDHSYDFNRGPGVLEVLLFHDRALRGEPAP